MASRRGWGPGWPNCQRSQLVTLVCGRNNLRLPVRKEVAPIFAALVADLEAARGEPFRPDWSWGFACRAIAGTSTPSNHSWGLAIDLDAPENGFQRGVPGPGRNTMPSNSSSIAGKYNMRWGGDYTRSADPMHYEFMGTPADAAAIVRELEGKGKTPAPTPKEDPDMLQYGDRGSEVVQLQHLLNRFIYETGGALQGGGLDHDRKGSHLAVDGVFGDKTREFLGHAVDRMQKPGFKVFGHPIYNPSREIATAQTIAWLVVGTEKVRARR